MPRAPHPYSFGLLRGTCFRAGKCSLPEYFYLPLKLVTMNCLDSSVKCARPSERLDLVPPDSWRCRDAYVPSLNSEEYRPPFDCSSHWQLRTAVQRCRPMGISLCIPGKRLPRSLQIVPQAGSYPASSEV